MSGSIDWGRFHFSWGQGKEQNEPTRRMQRGGKRDLTGGFQSNEEMLRGLYHGNFAGLQFSSPLCFVPVNLLTQMMGYPTPHSEDQKTQDALDEIMATMADRIARTHRGALVVGNAWRWPRYDSKSDRLVWESISDSSVSDILADVASEEATAILVDEMIKLSTGENQIVNVQRKRRFDRSQVDVKWFGQKPASVQDFSARNVSGILPINFANDADEGEFRGYSLFARVIRSMKDYHDISFRISETLAKFKVKQIQTAKDPDLWLEENGLDDSALESVDISARDFIINRSGEESTTYEFMGSDATSAMEKALERIFLTIVEGTGAPELFWGPLATGNHASTDTQLEQAVKYADTKRKEFSRPWDELIRGSLAVMSESRLTSYAPYTMGWNRLEAVSAETKSKILLSFSQAAGALVASGSCTPKQLFTLWELNFPETEPGKYEEFIAGISEMAKHKQFLGLDPFTALEAGMTSGDGATV
jgi:hypothetical protein